ncbi:MAG: glycosyl hydrolase 115 family protein [Bacteroidales bacterium]|nr:glycosyl hydrolase 115 family protein [Bacteroidales bacterium]
MQIEKMKRKFLILLFCVLSFNVFYAQNPQKDYITFEKNDNGFDISECEFVVSDDEWEGVKIAVRNLIEDIKDVTDHYTPGAGKKIIFGTLGKSSVIDKIVKKQKIDVSSIKGQWEAGMIYPLDENTLLVIGSDKRGTIFAVYDISQSIGVSPWKFWADVPTQKHDYVALNVKNPVIFPSPKVKYRGIFLNDEAPCLSTWVSKTFPDSKCPSADPALAKGMNSNFYAAVFELLLRLKANFMWPAMWGNAFYADDALNSKTADMMGIIMGTSHHEPMARNHQEWVRSRSTNGAWDYNTNQEVIDKFFREGIRRSKDNEDLITIGMRGDGDTPMGGQEGHDDEYVMALEKNKKLMERLFDNQRRIIAEETGKPAAQRQQVWALYKEVQDYYDAGLKVPDDVIILISDDNWGDIRRVPDQQRVGGWGIYYHVDYVGAPRNSKWLNVTQTQQMFEQLSLAYDFGIEKLWILNVGDLKPMEYPIQLFCDMAYEPKTYNLQNVTNHTEKFFESVVGKDFAKEATRIYNRNCQYMARVTPEMLDSRTYNVKTGEFKQVSDEYARLELEALRLYLQLPEEYKDAYYQLVLFPVQAMANLYDIYYAQAMNHYCANNNDPDANFWSDRVLECFKRDSVLCLHYNKNIANGKWDGMMIQKHIGYKSWNDAFPHEMLPETKRVAESQGGFVFEPGNGFVSMEAEHFYSANADGEVKWEIYPYYGRTRSAVALTPYTEPVGNSSLTYRFKLPEGFADSVKVHVVVKSTLDFKNVGGHQCAISIDSGEEKTVNFNADLLDKQPYMYTSFYPTIARRVVEKVVKLKVADSDIHTLTLTPKHSGIVFEKIVIDFGGYQGEYLFGKESEVKKEK